MQSMHVAMIVNMEYAVETEPVFWVEVLFGSIIARMWQWALILIRFLEGLLVPQL